VATSTPAGHPSADSVGVPQQRRRKTKFAVVLLAALSFLGLFGFLLFRSGAPPMRNAQLRDLRGNSWVRISDFRARDAGSYGVMLCYDPDRRRMVRIGGNPAFSNEVWSLDLGTTTWTRILPYVRDSADQRTRPGYGEGDHRGICYDRQNKCVWDYGGGYQNVA